MFLNHSITFYSLYVLVLLFHRILSFSCTNPRCVFPADYYNYYYGGYYQETTAGEGAAERGGEGEAEGGGEVSAAGQTEETEETGWD